VYKIKKKKKVPGQNLNGHFFDQNLDAEVSEPKMSSILSFLWKLPLFYQQTTHNNPQKKKKRKKKKEKR